MTCQKNHGPKDYAVATIAQLRIRAQDAERALRKVAGQVGELETRVTDVGRLLARHGARATAWKDVFDRGLDCEGAEGSGRERETALALAKALGKARNLEAGQQ